MYNGFVKFYNESKGYGFIVESTTNQEIFVHSKGLVDKIKSGMAVTFETQRGKKGVTAVNVRVVLNQ